MKKVAGRFFRVLFRLSCGLYGFEQKHNSEGDSGGKEREEDKQSSEKDPQRDGCRDAEGGKNGKEYSEKFNHEKSISQNENKIKPGREKTEVNRVCGREKIKK